MKLQKSILIGLILTLTHSIYAEENENERFKEKLFHFYITPHYISSYTAPNFEVRQLKNNPSINLLYKLTNDLFIGFNYSYGEKDNDDLIILPSRNNNYNIYSTSKNRESEYIVFKTQYFFWNKFYASLNLGLEKGFKEETKQIFFENNNLVSYLDRNRFYTNREFGTIGLGYRNEFFEWLLLGLELEFGYINSGYTKDIYTFNPAIRDSFITFQIDRIFNADDSLVKGSEFGRIYIYSGISL